MIQCKTTTIILITCNEGNRSLEKGCVSNGQNKDGELFSVERFRAAYSGGVIQVFS